MTIENEPKQIEWVADLIGEEYIHWPNDAKIYIDTGTGTGKTYFIMQEYIPYCYKTCTSVLYLCNRKALYNKLRPELVYIPGATLTTYQAIQSIICAEREPAHYDVIVADEWDFFWNDADFQDFSNEGFAWLTNQQDSQIIFMSATGQKYFKFIQSVFNISEEFMYRIPKNYDYVDAVHFYRVGQINHEPIDELPLIINDILLRSESEKILVYVKKMQRMEDLYKIYGDTADYYAGSQQNASWIDKSCISDDKFKKRILFTTIALDVGIDLKDRDLKHVIVELQDITAIQQSLGRKRPLDETDTCTFYFRNYDGRSFRKVYENKSQWVADAELYLTDKQAFSDMFLADEEGHTINYKKRIKENPLFEMDKRGGYNVNMIRLEKFKLDVVDLQQCKEGENSFKGFLQDKLGELMNKETDLAIEDELGESFSDFMERNYQAKTRYFRKVNLEELRDAFRRIGLHDKRMGINVLNGKLKDLKSEYRLEAVYQSHRNEPYWQKTYWIITRIDI